MLQTTFIHLDGFGQRREHELWRRGVSTWSDLQQAQERQLRLFRSTDEAVCSDGLRQSAAALTARDATFFAQRLASSEHYRIAYTFPEATLFFDIETTGLSTYYDTITLVGWNLNGEYGVYVRGQDPTPLLDILGRAKAIVTFNGTLFDLRFLRTFFPEALIPLAHIDLRFLCRRAGLPGPQKIVEKKIGIRRPSSLDGLDGKMAPLLWFDYCRGRSEALRTLIEYNRADIDGMKSLLDAAVKRLLRLHKVPKHLWPHSRFSPKQLSHPQIRLLPVIQRVMQDPQVAANQNTPLRTTYSHLSTMLRGRSLRIVGIDLTGSHKRPSGWAFLHGNQASTQLLRTDDELIRHTIQSQPDIVSIDSPLSIPAGRTSVGDDDPNRHTHGITRKCERTLRARGINVYPCLLPSMQKLTQRGIALATSFRRLGIPVIESYPGVVQDIVGMPRKRASLELLRAGLTDFGIAGVREDASHDELDAITSALVGVFFWTGQYEELGNDAEDYLIIPDLRATPTISPTARAIGFSGPIATGKTTAAQFLEARGYRYARFSMVLEKLLQDRGSRPSREALQGFGAEIHGRSEQRWLCRQLFHMIPADGNIVIDGLRHPEDHAFCVERFGRDFMHIHIQTPETARAARYQRSGFTEEAFKSADSHEVESNVCRLRDLAHVAVHNNDTLEAFQRVVTNIATVETNGAYL